MTLPPLQETDQLLPGRSTGGPVEEDLFRAVDLRGLGEDHRPILRDEEIRPRREPDWP